ncbi:RNA-splicing ligase RtcB [Salinibacter sp. 10B]|uniref:intein-containing RctB family protein n=1 Tax=Salinibacter sp. 10B TaxID=1923971 RepID=UPI000CF3C70E|nr:intein-containing RctB family protein [Salinibacter sp. 10B]PQJ34366.1 RNA-splicing ligase RtcB [Salinibacter sp. 10B]
MPEYTLEKLDDYRWQLPKRGRMNVPARLYASEPMLEDILDDDAPQQAINVAHMPGIVTASLAMPDIHWGYGFPIGGVAAFDPDDGVISPGGVGYDINCLSGDSEVLHAHGYTRTIAEMETTWQDDILHCHDLEASSSDETSVAAFLKHQPDQPVYRLRTTGDDEVLATGDHPFWTPDGMTDLDDLDPGDQIARRPFEGVPYDEPSDRILVDEADVRKVLKAQGKEDAGNAVGQVLHYLQERDLLPLRASDSAVPHLIKIAGVLFGDGTLYFSGDHEKGTAWFYAAPDDLEAIRSDVEAAGFTPSRIYRRERSHSVDTPSDHYEFERPETSFKVVSTSFAALMAALGVPVGDKAAQDYGIPAWLPDAPLWHQRLFLAPLFGAELSAPSTMTHYGRNFYAPALSLSKSDGFAESGRQFLEDLASIIEDFGVETKEITEVAPENSADGRVRLRLLLSSRTESMLALWSRIGYDYNQKRSSLAMAAVEYLKQKQQVLSLRETAAEQARMRHETGTFPSTIYDDLTGEHVNRRFLERALYGERKTGVRIGSSFPTFDTFCEDTLDGLEQSGMVWSTVDAIEPVNLEAETGDPHVYDFTVAHEDHNFVADGFVVSNCGVRLMSSKLTKEDIDKQDAERLVDTLFHRVPTGVGSSGALRVDHSTLPRVLQRGATWAVNQGYGSEADLDVIEEGGQVDGADPDAVSSRAKERGLPQLGTLGSGNHFLEVGYVSEVYNERAARIMGLDEGAVTVIIHSGSRGFGYQVCDDALQDVDRAMNKYNIELPDRQLACAPIDSPEGQKYLRGMRCAINYAFANRQVMAHNTRVAFEEALDLSPREHGLHTVYEVAHNIAKFETHRVNGRKQEVCVHRKGATRALPAGHPLVPGRYQQVGQPVLIPGDMGRYSYVLVGTDKAMDETFGSTCHGAGRKMSRRQARKTAGNRNITAELANEGIVVRGESGRTVREEIPEAYKDVADVVEAVEGAGLSQKVARLRPLGVIKG